MHGLHLPEATLTWALLALAVAFPIVITVAWLTGSFEGEIAPAGWRHAWPLAAALAALLLGAALFLYWRRAATPPPPTLVQATFEGGIEEYPAWSPDGKNLLYMAQTGLSRKIFRKNLRTGQVAQLTHGDADELQPAWSPDGSKILFVRAHDVSLDIANFWSSYALHSDGKQVARGINSIQAIKEAGGWRVTGIMVQAESATAPLPKEYLP